jgi:hypothetical protein
MTLMLVLGKVLIVVAGPPTGGSYMKLEKRMLCLLTLLMMVAFGLPACVGGEAKSNLRFGLSFTGERSEEPQDGRMLLLISANDSNEPRFQIGDGVDTQLVFGVDVDGLQPGEEAIVDADVFGYPLTSISEIPAGEYWVQGLINRYETFNRSDGHVVKLPPDMGEGQQWNTKPGNFYSTPKKVAIDPSRNEVIHISLDQEIPPIPDPPETKYIKHVKIESKLLTEFWGRPMYLGAHVLLPEGFDEHPEAKYPLVIYHGHFPYDFYGFSETPPDPNMEPEYAARFDWEGYNITQAEYAYEFYKEWTGPNFPRMIVIVVQHANPYYDDSYAVNSQNLGPYGDAIIYELVPHIEEKYRGIGEGWARATYGGSTGGWEALAVQVLYPDEYNSCYAACPDPIDFRAYTVVNLYEDKNAYYLDAQWKRTPRPGRRNYLGHVGATLEEMNHRELAFATKSRSGDQWDIWEAVYSPVGDDGYPKRIWDKMTGEIDPEVAEYWKENYDLSYILRRDWETIGPKLRGKIHIYCGDMDNYYLNNAVYLTEEFLESTTNPPYEGEVDYGDRAEHCWNGDHSQPNAISRLRYHQMYIPKFAERILKSAPPGADVTSWRY